MMISILTKLKKIGIIDTFQGKEEAILPSNHNEAELKLDEARKQIIHTLGEANDVRYFYTLNKENEQHIGFIMLEKAISKAILSDRSDLNELKENEIHLSKSIEQVNIYLSRRYLHTKMQQATEMIQKLSKDNFPIDQYLLDVQNALTIANECHANYLSTASEMRNAFDQLNIAIQAMENILQPA